jgi:hypothetical protein
VETPEQRFRSLTYSAYNVLGPAAGGTAVTTRVDSAFIEAALPTGETRREEIAQLRGISGSLLIGADGVLRRVEFDHAAGAPSEAVETLAQSLRALQVSFPNRAVAVGDSWDEMRDVPLELPGLNEPVRLRLRKTLRAVHLDDAGDTTVVIELGFRLPDKPFTVHEGEAVFSMALSGEWTGVVEYSLARGATIVFQMGGSIRVEITNGGLRTRPIAMRMDQRITQRLLASGAP